MHGKSCVGLKSLSIAADLVGGVLGESKHDVGSPSGQVPELNELVDGKWLGDPVFFIHYVGRYSSISTHSRHTSAETATGISTDHWVGSNSGWS